ncbi:MAG: hypothetical protein AAGJ80_10110, partial [Cyanobacteria bacterium J06553_1]
KCDHYVYITTLTDVRSRSADKVGQWLHETQPLTVKAHGRLAKSVFRYGFDYLRHIFLNLTQPQQ